jgi:hypothetical protein
MMYRLKKKKNHAKGQVSAVVSDTGPAGPAIRAVAVLKIRRVSSNAVRKSKFWVLRLFREEFTSRALRSCRRRRWGSLCPVPL